MTRKAPKNNQRSNSHASFQHARDKANSSRPHIFLTDPNVQEIKRALSPFWAWRVER